MSEINITKHAYKRAKQRLGFKKSALDNIIDKVIEEGISHKETSGQLNKFITKLWFKNKNAIIKIYGENLYFFDNKFKNLITVYQVPNRLKNHIR